MDIRWIAIAATLPLTACAAADTSAESAPTPPPAEAACNADGVQSLVGQTATAAVGGQLLKGSGAATLRWVPPRTAVTMDFRPDRLTVSYDDALKIERISCG
ncbi:I78 family peptidase inhibitor [Sphingopyxis sp.]|uniref:I78 family peptidase inhibitor n=1 Tax=Sphingopyxis sp. TaxID=1908224 RepID=UPI002FC84777